MTDKEKCKKILNIIDGYIEGQENHPLNRSEKEISTIKAVAHWCKKAVEDVLNNKEN